MKIMALADVHQSKKHWLLLEEVVREIRPELVLIAGDLMPKYDGILAQVSFMPQIRQHASRIKSAGAELVMILGNDDNQLVISEMEKGEEEGLWHYVSDRVKEIRGYEFCGCPWIRDYPFAYKYWVAPDRAGEVYIDPVQLGPPAVINDQNEIETIPDLETYLKSKISVQESLENMAKQVISFADSIWLIHDPPINLGFDLCATGDRVGSPVIYDFLGGKQPLLSIHGHIHEAPSYNGGIWAQKLGSTMCIQPGQLENELSYVTFDLENRRIKNLFHSIYGNGKNL